MQHAFRGRDSGLVEVRIKQMSDGVLRIQVTDDGRGCQKVSNGREVARLAVASSHSL